MVGGVRDGEIVLLGREEDLRLDGEMLTEGKVNEASKLSAYLHIRTHRLAITRDDEVTHIRAGEHTTGNYTREVLLIQRVEHGLGIPRHDGIRRFLEGLRYVMFTLARDVYGVLMYLLRLEAERHASDDA